MAQNPDDPDSGSKVVPLPLSRERATEIIREIARDSRRWSIVIPYKDPDLWRGFVNRRHIERILREGYVLQEHAELDDKGNWTCQIARVCAGMNVVIDVAFESEGRRPSLFVLKINGSRIE